MVHDQRNVGYLVNQYPKGSHTFIRREILALEGQGLNVIRMSFRGWNDETVVDPSDRNELERTFFTQRLPWVQVIYTIIIFAILNPGKFIKGLNSSIRLSAESKRSTLTHFFYLVQAIILFQHCKHRNVFHVHSHFATNSTKVAYLLRVMGGPSFSFTVHGPEEFYDLRDAHLNELVAASEFVCAISSYCRSQLFYAISRKLWKKIVLVRCGLESEFLNRSVDAVHADNQRFIFVGRLDPEKGCFQLVSAFSKCLELFPEAKLTIVGDGSLRSDIEATVVSLGISDSIEMTGWISSDRVREELQKSRCLVSASFAEGLPVVFMEALSCKRPVIATSIAGTPELVDMQCGWLVPPSDDEALTSAMIDALTLPLEKIHLKGEVGRDRVLKSHCVDDEAKKLMSQFDQVHSSISGGQS